MGGSTDVLVSTAASFVSVTMCSSSNNANTLCLVLVKPSKHNQKCPETTQALEKWSQNSSRRGGDIRRTLLVHSLVDLIAFVRGLESPFEDAFRIRHSTLGTALPGSETAEEKTRIALTKFVETSRYNRFNEDSVVAQWRAGRR